MGQEFAVCTIVHNKCICVWISTLDWREVPVETNYSLRYDERSIQAGTKPCWRRLLAVPDFWPASRLRNLLKLPEAFDEIGTVGHQ